MPYVITTYRNGPWPHTTAVRDVQSHYAVATLEEAHAATREAVARAYDAAYNADAHADAAGEGWLDYVTSDDPQSPFVSEHGGTVRPLPDGTMLEVAPCDRFWLLSQMGQPESDARTTAKIIDAFNTRHGAA